MFLWKDKVAEKLSQLLADSPALPRREPSAAPEIPLRLEGIPSPKKSNASSLISSFILTSSFEHDWSNSDETSSPHAIIPLLHLSPRQQATCCFPWNGRVHEANAESGNVIEGDGVATSGSGAKSFKEMNAIGSHGNDKGTALQVSGETLPYLTEESTFISSDLFDFLESSLPNIVKGCQWILMYSTVKHGISLRTLIRKSNCLSGPCLLIVGDMQGIVLGGLLDCPLKPTAKKKYQGTNQSFVFTTKYGEPRLFRATGANRYYYLCLNDVLAFGGGDNFALCLDEDLLHGTSGPCDTFGNLCLAHSLEFELKNVELWGFTHMSRYIT